MTKVINDVCLEVIVDNVNEAHAKLYKCLAALLPNKGDEILVEKEHLSEDINFDDGEGVRYVFAGVRNVGYGYICLLGYEMGDYLETGEMKLQVVDESYEAQCAVLLQQYYAERDRQTDNK